jgi:hypothetical protein
MSAGSEAGTAGTNGGGKTRRPLPLADVIKDKKRLLYRASLIIDDVGLGKDSLLVPLKEDGTINQPKLVQSLTVASELIKNVEAFLERLADEAGLNKQGATS